MQQSSEKCQSIPEDHLPTVSELTRALPLFRSGVFGVYGIAVDYRHLTILADYMVSGSWFAPDLATA